MDESLLHKISIFIVILGFSALILIFLFSETEELTTVIIPENQEVQFRARLESVHRTPSGSSLKLVRDCSQTAFISANVSKNLENSDFIVTGSLSGDFFSISSLEPILLAVS